MENQLNQSKQLKEEDINLRQLFEQYAFYWKWFILTIVLALGLAFVYLRYAQKSYEIGRAHV